MQFVNSVHKPPLGLVVMTIHFMIFRGFNLNYALLPCIIFVICAQPKTKRQSIR